MLMSVAFVPLYLKYLGREAYGLVAFQTSLQIIFSLMEFGFPAGLMRELGRGVDYGGKNYFRDLIRSVEILSWGAGTLVLIVVVTTSAAITTHWLKIISMPTSHVTQAVVIMGILIAINLPGLIYTGGLNGLQKQVSLNTICVIIAFLRGVGALVLVTNVLPDIRIFLLWHVLMGLLHAFILRGMLNKDLPGEKSATLFRFETIKRIGKFSSKIMLYSIILTFASQIDKLTISKVLTIDQLGYYSIAGFVANLTMIISTAMVTAIYPVLCRTIADPSNHHPENYYLRASQWLGFMSWPLTAVIFFFSDDILFLWTRNTIVARAAHSPLSLLALSMNMAAVIQMPNSLSGATGQMRYTLWGTFFLVLITAPLTIAGTIKFGLTGAAAASLTVNMLYVLLVATIIHRKYLPGQNLKWIWRSILKPAGASFFVAYLFYILSAATSAGIVKLIMMSLAAFGSYFILFGMQYIRQCILICNRAD